MLNDDSSVAPASCIFLLNSLPHFTAGAIPSANPTHISGPKTGTVYVVDAHSLVAGFTTDTTIFHKRLEA